MPDIQIGAHVRDGDPLAEGRARDADIVQFFLADPQGWKAPRPHPLAEELRRAARAHDPDLVIHAPYVLNVASTNNRIRIPSRKLLDQHAAAAVGIGAIGLVVHGGHVVKGHDVREGYENWTKAVERGSWQLPVLIENTAGGDGALARSLGGIARLWEAVAGRQDGPEVGFCLDTCHAWAAGLDLQTVADDIRAITGRIDLVHLNSSRDEAGSGRDRHAGLAGGTIPVDLLAHVGRSAGAPLVVETPADGQAADISLLHELLS